ncbi:hypothetical protein ETAA8_28160 [Anatilimnocola aggregata]|uniref:2-oxoadipate dioxygenase/decarboxylase n=1 Tax=Anatilimnocola aggregata TaxID=2528021 RepID=A0A517YBV2_9BACT|nr:DUF1338 domain-containing protein [Anatilimnocola aggregata]QDU27726.1 hypothetical protein ETAA8_28160 [Anatilimnocola aggregata]
MTAISGPHERLAGDANREQFLAAVFDALWERYRSRVSYVQTYEKVVHEAGATFFNDHIAFRTLAVQQPQAGIASVSRVFEALGYRAAGSYHFEDKQLSAIHFQHPNVQFPKLFVSELKTWELPAESRSLIELALAAHRPQLRNDLLAELAGLDQSKPTDSHRDLLMTEVVDWFHTLPWKAPEKAAVQKLNAVSQYGAWTLVHGYNVNHFTSLVNSHGVPQLNDLEKTMQALAAAGVPIKTEIEGERGSKLRQSATEAVKIDVDVREGATNTKLPWSYAYFELAERNEITDAATGNKVRFEGFLGPQATNLFEMTRLK